MSWFGKYFGRFFGGRFFGRWPPGGEAPPEPEPTGPSVNEPDSRTGMAGGIEPSSVPWLRWPGLVREFVWTARRGTPGEAEVAPLTARVSAGRVEAIGGRALTVQPLPTLRAHLGRVEAEGVDRDEHEFLEALQAGVFDDLLDDEEPTPSLEPYVYDEAAELAEIGEVLKMLGRAEEDAELAQLGDAFAALSTLEEEDE